MFYRVLIIMSISFTFANSAQDLRNLQSFQGDFVQTITSSDKKEIQYKGKVYIKNDGKILWKYETPVIKNVYVLKDYAIVDEPELEQAIYTKLEDEVNIVKMLNDSQKINSKEYISKVGDTNYLISTKDGEQVDSISYKDKLDNNVKIIFSSVSQNVQISNKLFIFNAPEYYDIIKK